ncbi:hypothetical protein B566_EDAN006195 [Ephemera danica]|nr:hypothetical protein B566_EDAN006195 [Ephemera danica]
MNNQSHLALMLRHVYGFVYRRRFLTCFFALLAFVGFLAYLLLSWGIVCSNLEVWQHVYKVVSIFSNIYQLPKQINMNCQPLHAGKELVFSAVLDGMPLVFKSSKRTSMPDIRTKLFWEDEHGLRYYPNEEEFSNMIASLIQTEMNVTTSHEEVQKLSQLGPVPTRTELRHIEMQNLWELLQDHEYLAIRLFAEQEIFPNLVGSCGGFFAVEYAEHLSIGVIWDHEDDTWSERLRDSMLILELLERLESTASSPLRFCDVHSQHFGKSFDGTKIMILDGDSVVTKTMADVLSGDGQTCKDHRECRYFDCHAACEHGKCVSPSVNNNLQSVCENVFLGHKWGGAMLVPGLLASPHASPALQALLRLCAHPHGEEGIKHGTPDDIRERLQDDTWSERLRDSMLILELLERLESTASSPLRFCDVHSQHFGKSFDGTKIMILDGDSVVTKTMADVLSGDGQTCKDHRECRYFDCHAACEHGKCVSPSVNNNLQSVCENVFLGHKWGGAMLVPGLLASPHASPALQALLRLCAHPHGEEGIKHGTPDDIRERLQVTIEEMVNDLDSKAL